MRAVARGITCAVMGLALLAGCRGPLVFSCSNDNQCRRAGHDGGKCVRAKGTSTPYCAFKDLNCDSALRFDATAGEGLSGVCLGSGVMSGDLGMAEDLATPVDLGEEDLVGEPPPDLVGEPELRWIPATSGTISNLWCVGGYDDNHVWAGGEAGLWFSGDNGKSWNRQVLPGNAASVTGIYAVNHQVWVMNHATQIFHSPDDGGHWEPQVIPNGVSGRLFGIWATSPSNIFVVGDGGIMLHYDGLNWNEQVLAGGNVGYLNAIWGGAKDDVWASGGSGVAGVRSPMAHTVNGGNQWSVGSLSSDMIIFRMWGSSTTDIYAVGEQQVIYHSAGGAFSVLRKETGSPDDAFFGIWGTGADNLYVAGTGGLLVRTTDGGKSWRDLASGSAADLAAIWGNRWDNVFVVGSGGTILHGTP